MKLLLKLFQEKLKFQLFQQQICRLIIDHFNFLIVFISCIFLFAEASMQINYEKIEAKQTKDIVIISSLFGINLLFYAIKRINTCSLLIRQLLDIIIAIGSFEIFFEIDQCEGDRFVLSLIQIQYLLSQKNKKKQLNIYLLWLSLIYFALRLYLYNPIQHILKRSITIFLLSSGYILAYFLEIIKEGMLLSNSNYEQNIKQQKFLYKNNNMSNKSSFNLMQINKKKQENLMQPSTDTHLKNPFNQSRKYGDEEIQLNMSHQIQIPIILDNSKQRDSDIESILFSCRALSNNDQLKQSLLQELEKNKQQEIGSFISNNNQQQANIFTQEECIKSAIPGNSQNYNILQQLSIGIILVDDQKQVIFSNDHSMQILKENEQSNLINKLYDFSTFSQNPSNNTKQLNKNSHKTEDKQNKHENEVQENQQQIKQDKHQTQKRTSICIDNDEEQSPDNRKKKCDQTKKDSSARLFASLKDIVHPSTSFHDRDTTKFTKIFSGNLNGVDEKLSLSDCKDEYGMIFNQINQRSQRYKLSLVNNDGQSQNSHLKQNPQSIQQQIKKSEIRRLNLHLNKELNNLLKHKNTGNINLKQIFDILLEASNYQSFDNNHILVKSKTEQMWESTSSEGRQLLKKYDSSNLNKKGQETIQASPIAMHKNDSDSDQDDSNFQSQEATQLNCFIKDNLLLIKAQQGNDIIDLKMSVLLEVSTVYETIKYEIAKEIQSTNTDFYQDKHIFSNQRQDKYRESIEETKLQFHNAKEKGSDIRQEKSNQQNKQIKSDIRLFLIIEVYDKKEDIAQINQEAFKDFKNRILSSLSHELRTPLNCSLSMLEMLFQSDLLNVDQKKMLILPALNSNYLLLSMINDILDFAQILSGGLNLQFHEFNIVDLLRECMSYFTLQAVHKNILLDLNFEKNLPQTIRSDSMRMKQVINNLLSNAIKFTTQGQITINVDLEEKDLIKVSISDTGCGIPQEVGNQIFRGLEFNQNNANLNTENAGMGLTIANNISKGLSGNRPIEFVSEVNKGSTFSFFVLDRPSKIKGCQSTKFTLFNHSYTNWKPLFQDSSDKMIPSTVFDQITQNNNLIMSSNSIIPHNPTIYPQNPLFQSQQQFGPSAQYVSSQMINYPILKSKTFSYNSIPQRSFNDFNSRMINYINQNNQQQMPQTSINNIKSQEITYSEENIHSYDQIPKSFQDLNHYPKKNNLDNNSSIDQDYNEQHYHFPSEGNIKPDQSFDNPKYQNKQDNNNLRKQLDLYKLQQQHHQQYQNHSLQYKIPSLKHIHGSSLKLVEDKSQNSMKSCEIETENSQIKNYPSPQINFIVAHRKSSANENNQYIYSVDFNSNKKQNQYDEIIQESLFKDSSYRIENTYKSDMNQKQYCYTDEPPSVFINQNREEIYNKQQITPKQAHSMRTLQNDSFSLNLNEKQQRQTEDDISHQITIQNQSNKNSTNVLASTNSKNIIRIKDLEIEDIQTHLTYFLSLQQSSHVSYMHQSNSNIQHQQSLQSNYVVYNSLHHAAVNYASPRNRNSSIATSFTHQSNLSVSVNLQQKNTQSRQLEMCSPKNIVIQPLLYQVQNTPNNKLSKKSQSVNKHNSCCDTNSHSKQIPDVQDLRSRAESIKSRNKESLNYRMENIIEIQENFEMDEHNHSNLNMNNSNQSALQESNIVNPLNQNVSKQNIIQKNKSKTCNCKNVLVIDDTEFNLLTFEMRLKQYGFQVETAISGILGEQKVIQKYQNSECCPNYTLIFMDLDMPIQNGFETTINVLNYFKQQKAKPPIISACSAYVTDNDKKKAKQAGMKYYLTKPVETQALENVISQVIFRNH